MQWMRWRAHARGFRRCAAKAPAVNAAVVIHRKPEWVIRLVIGLGVYGLSCRKIADNFNRRFGRQGLFTLFSQPRCAPEGLDARRRHAAMLAALQGPATPQTAPRVHNPKGRAVLARPSALRSLHGRPAHARRAP